MNKQFSWSGRLYQLTFYKAVSGEEKIWQESQRKRKGKKTSVNFFGAGGEEAVV